MRLVRVALLHERARVQRRRGLVRLRLRAASGSGRTARPGRRRQGRCSRLPTTNAPPRAPRPAALAERDDPVARERVAQVLDRAEHGAAERMLAERGVVDQVLGDGRRLVVRARDLLDHDAALAVQLLGVESRAPDEVRQQVDRLERALGAHGDVEGDEVVARVRVELAADPLGRLVDRSVVGELLAALEDEVLEEVRHPVLLRALGARAGVERDERGDGARAVELQAVDREPVRGDGGRDRGHAVNRSEHARLAA